MYQNYKGVGRIFAGLFPERRAAEIMCIAYRRGLNGVNHLWILLGHVQKPVYPPFNITMEKARVDNMKMKV